jgi:hypothetical protein
MRFGVDGIGLWGQGFSSWEDFCGCINDDFEETLEEQSPPNPENIPGRERRRAPLSVKLAVEVIGQAARMANTKEHDLCSVFSSAMGDNHISDYICRTLAGPDKALSPTIFHNSVNNVTSGYWCIATKNHQPSTFVSCFNHSFPAALLEAVSLATSESRKTALAIYDVAFGPPLFDICPIAENFAAGFIINPDADNARWQFQLNIEQKENPSCQSNKPFINSRIRQNPSAQALMLCELITSNRKSIEIPMSSGTGLQPTLSIQLSNR